MEASNETITKVINKTKQHKTNFASKCRIVGLVSAEVNTTGVGHMLFYIAKTCIWTPAILVDRPQLLRVDASSDIAFNLARFH